MESCEWPVAHGRWFLMEGCSRCHLGSAPEWGGTAGPISL